jgi:glycerate kinase
MLQQTQLHHHCGGEVSPPRNRSAISPAQGEGGGGGGMGGGTIWVAAAKIVRGYCTHIG